MFVNGLEVGSDGRIVTAAGPVLPGDAVSGAFSYDPATRGVRVVNALPQYYANGFGFNAGQLCIGDPPVTFTQGGLPFNALGQLVTDGVGGTLFYNRGWPLSPAGLVIKPLTPAGYGATDPAISSVVFLSKFETQAGSGGSASDTPIIFVGGGGGNVTLSWGTGNIDTVTFKYGTKAWRSTGGGANDDQYAFTLAGGLGAGDFALEGWQYLVGLASSTPWGMGSLAYFGPNGNSAGAYGISFDKATNKLVWSIGTGLTDPTGNKIVSSTTIAVGAWRWIQALRLNGILQMGIDGVQEGASYTDPNNYAHTQVWGMALNSPGAQVGLIGKVDELRITRAATGALVGKRSLCLPTNTLPTT